MSPETNNPSQPRGFDVQAASRFEYEIGNEHSPTDPFGRQHVVIFSGDRFEYTVYKKQGRIERLSGSLRVEILQLRDLAKYGNVNGPQFEDLVAKWESSGLTMEQACEQIVLSSRRSNKQYDAAGKSQ
jgi:hypothetical protein